MKKRTQSEAIIRIAEVMDASHELREKNSKIVIEIIKQMVERAFPAKQSEIKLVRINVELPENNRNVWYYGKYGKKIFVKNADAFVKDFTIEADASMYYEVLNGGVLSQYNKLYIKKDEVEEVK